MVDREIIEEVRASNEACITLMTVMAMDGSRKTAAELCASNDQYSRPTTCMALATLAISAISTLALELGVDPLEIIQIAGLSAAQHVIDLENGLEEE